MSNRIDSSDVFRLALASLSGHLPICENCFGRPAVCIGRYESTPMPEPACDVCCGHRNEDGWCILIAELPALAAKQRRELDAAHAEIERLRAQIEQMAAHPLVVATRLDELSPEQRAKLRVQLASITRAPQQLVLEATTIATDPPPAAQWRELLAGSLASLNDLPAVQDVRPAAVGAHHDPADVARIAALEAELARARRAVAFFTTAVDDGFDWEGWLEGSVAGPPPEVGRHERIAELETALRGLVARVDRAGGYASPEEQDVLRAARQVLGGAGAA